MKLMVCLLLALLTPGTHLLAAEIQVQGLFGGAAVVVIDGQKVLLKQGQSKLGVRLVSADSTHAIIEVDGETRKLGLSDHIASSFSKAERGQIQIPLNNNNQYITPGSINGRVVSMLIDTGANVIAMNSGMAKSLDISLHNGQKTKVSTAGGVKTATHVMLKQVKVGDIRLNDVAAVVIEGSHPREILLGMSFLQHVNITENGRLMILTSRL